jgi:hypothetical protein
MNDVGAGFIRVCTFGRVGRSWLHNDRHGTSSDASRPEDNQVLCVCAQKGAPRIDDTAPHLRGVAGLA